MAKKPTYAELEKRVGQLEQKALECKRTEEALWESEVILLQEYIIQHRKTTSLAFYVAFIESLTKELFPEIIDAFGEFTQTFSWDVIAQATADGYSTAGYHADAICDIFRKEIQKKSKKCIEKEIAIRLLKPLSVT